MTLDSLKQLARFWPIIFGKAQTHEQSLGVSTPHNGRPDFIDDSTIEMRAALEAMDALTRLHEENPTAARILYVVHVVWGVDARRIKENWVDLARVIRERPPQKPSATLRQKLYCEAVAEYDRARKVWAKL
jgi:hypothetical protein